MKIQILISKNSWANQYVDLIRKKLKKNNDSVFIYDNHKKLKYCVRYLTKRALADNT